MISNAALQTQNSRNVSLDGLRGIAILMVILFHYFTGFYVFDFGWSGVDLFFILSGYLLSGRIIPFLDDKKIIWKFYLNRILRIIPLYFSFLIVFYLGYYFLASNETQNFSEQLNNPVAFFGFVCNWLFILFFNPSQHQLSHLWSLAVEEQFYLLFPIYVLIIKHQKKLLQCTILAIALIAVSRCLHMMIYSEMNVLKIYWNSFYRMDSFLFGVLIYLLNNIGFFNKFYKSIPYILIITTIAILVGGFYENTFRVNYFFVTIGFTLNAIVYGCVLIFTLNENNNFLKRIMSNKLLVFFGKISFGLYIFHWPIYLTMFSATNLFAKKLGFNLSTQHIQLLNIMFSFLSVTIISFLSFKYYESIFLKWKQKPVTKPLLS